MNTVVDETVPLPLIVQYKNTAVGEFPPFPSLRLMRTTINATPPSKLIPLSTMSTNIETLPPCFMVAATQASDLV
ncbi:hypothetical protein AeRB84_006417, partial [Aphanomyces euteiches]